MSEQESVLHFELSSEQKASISVIQNELSCECCKNPLVQAYRLGCHHCICKDCATGLLNQGGLCPVCKKVVKKNTVSIDPLYTSLAAKLHAIEVAESKLKPKQSVRETPQVKRSGGGVHSIRQGIRTQSPISSPKKSLVITSPSRSYLPPPPPSTSMQSDSKSKSKSKPNSQLPLSPSKVIRVNTRRTIEIVSDSSNDGVPSRSLPHSSERASSSSSSLATSFSSELLNPSNHSRISSSTILEDHSSPSLLLPSSSSTTTATTTTISSSSSSLKHPAVPISSNHPTISEPGLTAVESRPTMSTSMSTSMARPTYAIPKYHPPSQISLSEFSSPSPPSSQSALLSTTTANAANAVSFTPPDQPTSSLHPLHPLPVNDGHGSHGSRTENGNGNMGMENGEEKGIIRSDTNALPLTQFTRCGDFVISDYIIITSSLSPSNMDRIRLFAARSSVLWMQDFPKEEEGGGQTGRRRSSVAGGGGGGGGKGKRRDRQKYILVIRAKDGWCKRTVKYLYALAHGAWVVSMEWINANLSAQSLIPPDDYEVKGDLKTNIEFAPRTSRIAHEKGQPGIFSGIFFFVRVRDNGAGIPINILIDLMHHCGCVKNMGDMSHRKGNMRMVEVVERLTSKSGMDVVTVDWILNCIGGWKSL